MKVWFNRISESRRSMIDLDGSEFRIGRDQENDIVLTSPLVSRQHAVVRVAGEQLELENLGINSCLVGDTEILGGQTASFTPGAKIPYLALYTLFSDRIGLQLQPGRGRGPSSQ